MTKHYTTWSHHMESPHGELKCFIFLWHLLFSGATSPTSVPDSVPKLLPVLKRSNSSSGIPDPVVPPSVPKLLPVSKRSNSSQGIPEPVASPIATSPPAVRIKQEKPESPMDFSPCQESSKKVWQWFHICQFSTF